MRFNSKLAVAALGVLLVAAAGPASAAAKGHVHAKIVAMSHMKMSHMKAGMKHHAHAHKMGMKKHFP
jgi:ABC-type sugar transport system substrate-binding protein